MKNETFVLEYVRRGWFVAPLCWPDSEGNCACGRGEPHAGRAGKIPLFRGYMDARFNAAEVRDIWGYRPDANVGLLLEPSNLYVIDLDSPEAIEEARDRGLPDTFRVKTSHGYHYYYRRPEGVPAVRVTEYGDSGAIDILSNGFVVAPPSLHADGYRYEVDMYPTGDVLPEPPEWSLVSPAWKAGVDKPRRSRVYKSITPLSEGEIEEAIRYIPADDYSTWLHVGFCLREWEDTCQLWGRGFDLWDRWSRGSEKYPGTEDLRDKWRSFKRDDMTVGTLVSLAKAHGWVRKMPERRRLGTWKAYLEDGG